MPISLYRWRMGPGVLLIAWLTSATYKWLIWFSSSVILNICTDWGNARPLGKISYYNQQGLMHLKASKWIDTPEMSYCWRDNLGSTVRLLRIITFCQRENTGRNLLVPARFMRTVSQSYFPWHFPFGSSSEEKTTIAFPGTEQTWCSS